jgi:predicted negative regulator of RcsB-dependent stress response
MKTSERHRLKGNELSQALSGASARLAHARGRYTAIALAIVLVIGAAIGFLVYRSSRENRAQALLSQAMAVVQAPIEEPKPGETPAQPAPAGYPTMNARAEAALAKFTDVFTAYPSTKAGIAARYYAAAALTLIGRPAEAVTRYQEVVERAGAGTFYGRMAQLGVVTSGVQAKQFDQAIAAGQQLANDTTNEIVPRDVILMELGRAYAAAGKKAEAKQALDEVIAKFPGSAYAEEAKQLLGQIA